MNKPQTIAFRTDYHSIFCLDKLIQLTKKTQTDIIKDSIRLMYHLRICKNKIKEKESYCNKCGCPNFFTFS